MAGRQGRGHAPQPQAQQQQQHCADSIHHGETIVQTDLNMEVDEIYLSTLLP
jgi:hypothetical protein